MKKGLIWVILAILVVIVIIIIAGGKKDVPVTTDATLPTDMGEVVVDEGTPVVPVEGDVVVEETPATPETSGTTPVNG